MKTNHAKNQVKKSYPNEVTKKANDFGYKAANLIYLMEKLPGYQNNSSLKLAVPKLVSLSHDDVSKHLNKILPSWGKSWSDFVENFKIQENKTSLDHKSKEILNTLRIEIKKAFAQNPIITNKKQTQALDKSSLVMVRSTGLEDDVDNANPGGNESVPSKFDNKNISNAIGEVVASYFSEKSLSQRLKAKDDITQNPFMAVLIQNLVGEGLSNDDGIVYSGVMYSGNGATRIQAAPGHGELIVNSKGNFDNFYITSQNMVYAEVQNKDFRLKPKYNMGTKKLSLVEEDNKIDTALSHSLSETVAQEMHKIAQYIEQIYDMRMDVEFVYDPKSNVLNIVQARPIPEGDRANHVPSSLDPLYIKEIIKDGGQIFKGNTITPEVNHAVTIDNAEQIIVCDKIEEALDVYLKNSKDIKAVVVKNNAPDTGHEAGEFSSKAIPVIRIADIGKVEALLEELKDGKKIIVDPQRKSVFQLPSNPSTKEFIKEGLFKSTLTSNVSSYKHEFQSSKDNLVSGATKNVFGVFDELNSVLWDNFFQKNKTKLFSNVSSFSQELFNINSINIVEEPNNLGDLITAAKKGQAGAFEKLCENIWNDFLKDNKSIPHLKDLNEALEVLENPYGDLSEHTNALKIVLKLATNLYKTGKISHDLFVQTMISGAELGGIINNDLRQIGNQLFERAEDKQKIYTEYLNVFEKLQGTINASAEKDVLSDSIFMNLSEKHHEQEMLKLAPNQNWNKTQKANFVIATKLEQFFISQNSKANWINFCKEICASQYSNQLVNLVGNIVKMGIHAQWCNTTFVKTYKENKDKPYIALGKMLNEAKTLLEKKDDFKKIDRAINELKKQISLWKEPKDFDELHKKFQEKLGQIKKKLKINKTDSALQIMLTSKQMHDLVDAFDLTIKSLEKSTIYTDKIQQAKKFQIILRDFAELMKDWMEMTGCTQKEIIEYVDYKLDDSRTLTEKDLSLSGKFDVSSATIYSKYDSKGWVRTLNKCETLEDYFTLIHQNAILLASHASDDINKELFNECPHVIQALHESLTTTYYMNWGALNTKLSAVEFNYPEISFHYNTPLRNHSSRSDIKYHCSTKEISLVYSAFGENENHRWTAAELKSTITFMLLSNIEIIKYPNFDEDKNAFSFEIKINNTQDLQIAQKIIDDVNKNSLEEIQHNIIQSKMKINLQEYSENVLNDLVKHCDKKLNNMPDKIYSFPNGTKKWFKKEILILKLELAKKDMNFDFMEFIDKHPCVIQNDTLYKPNILAPKIIEKYGFKYLSNFNYLSNFQELFTKAIELNKGVVSFSKKEWNGISSTIYEFATEEKYTQWFKESILPKFDQKTLELAFDQEQKWRGFFENEKLIEILKSELSNREHENIKIDFSDNSGRDNQESSLGGDYNLSDDE